MLRVSGYARLPSLRRRGRQVEEDALGLSQGTCHSHIDRVPPFVLVVDDDPTVKQTTCRFLTQAGYGCGGVGNAMAALTAIGAGPRPDVLVLDVRLPDLPGTELALRARDSHPGIPVIFVSAYTVELANLRTLAGVRWQFLSKPYTSDELVTAVSRFVPPPVTL